MGLTTYLGRTVSFSVIMIDGGLDCTLVSVAAVDVVVGHTFVIGRTIGAIRLELTIVPLPDTCVVVDAVFIEDTIDDIGREAELGKAIGISRPFRLR